MSTARSRAQRQAKRARRERARDEVRAHALAHGTPAVFVEVDVQDMGQEWRAVVQPVAVGTIESGPLDWSRHGEQTPRAVLGTSARDVFVAARRLVEEFAVQVTPAVVTLHLLDGDPEAWDALARREGLRDHTAGSVDEWLADEAHEGPPRSEP